MMLAEDVSPSLVIAVSTLLLAATGAMVYIGLRPAIIAVRQKHIEWDLILRQRLLMEMPAWMITLISAVAMVVLGLLGWLIAGSLIGLVLLGAVGMAIPTLLLRRLAARRLRRLEEQLVGGIQTIASGVRAGLNLVQSMQLLARDGPAPIREEFAHMVREYEYGVPLEQAMDKAAARIGSGDFRLLFAALHTHRERGGDLGDTLDRIGESIREIQRLEKRVQTLTAQGRTTARWLSAMPAVVIGILYIIDRQATMTLFTEQVGMLLLALIVVLNILGYVWIRKIVSVDI